jgi:hypothetical protein
MSETDNEPDTNEPDTNEILPRKLRIEDFISESEPINKYDKNYSQHDNVISKNQRDFGHRKRIKP